MRWAGHVARMGEEKGVYRVLVGKPEGKRPLGRPRLIIIYATWLQLYKIEKNEMGWACGAYG